MRGRKLTSVNMDRGLLQISAI